MKKVITVYIVLLIICSILSIPSMSYAEQAYAPTVLSSSTTGTAMSEESAEENDVYSFDICFGGRSLSTKRGHYDDYYYVDYENGIMLDHTIGKVKGKEEDYLSAFVLDVFDEGSSKILRWNDYTGEVSKAYIRIDGSKVYWYNIKGKLSHTYTASYVSSSVMETLSSAENFDEYCTPSLAREHE